LTFLSLSVPRLPAHPGQPTWVATVNDKEIMRADLNSTTGQNRRDTETPSPQAGDIQRPNCFAPPRHAYEDEICPTKGRKVNLVASDEDVNANFVFNRTQKHSNQMEFEYPAQGARTELDDMKG